MQRQALQISGIKAHAYKAGIDEVEFKQVVTESRSYPSKRGNTGLGDALVPESDFGFPTQDYENQSTRVAWVPVPAGTTQEQIEQMLKACPNPGIKRIISNQPIKSTAQEEAIAAGITTERIIAYGTNGTSGQLRRYGANSTNGTPGTPILDANGKEQFSINVFVKDVVASPDIDLRDATPATQVAATPAPTQAAGVPLGSAADRSVSTVPQPTTTDVPF